jgi:NADH:ubiquinone oxidoreductase subunit K
MATVTYLGTLGIMTTNRTNHINCLHTHKLKASAVNIAVICFFATRLYHCKYGVVFLQKWPVMATVTVLTLGGMT